MFINNKEELLMCIFLVMFTPSQSNPSFLSGGVYDETQYQLLQIHLHWGCNDQAGSEHVVQSSDDIPIGLDSTFHCVKLVYQESQQSISSFVQISKDPQKILKEISQPFPFINLVDISNPRPLERKVFVR